jgi:hypothetical protein
MNLPFSPTFFRKKDIFQQLMEFESQKKKKQLWERRGVELDHLEDGEQRNVYCD